MASTGIDAEAIKAGLAADSRNISVIWNEAINQYNKLQGQHRKTAGVALTTPNFKDAQAIKDFGLAEMQKFDFFRHGDSKCDRLRRIFMQNIDYISDGSTQLLSAVSTSFPPALAISTAMTFVMSAFKKQSEDYDVVVNFFEDMNSFLQRVSIIEKRVPREKAYQNALMDVFTALLSLCAVARSYILLGRLRKWVANAIFGGDGDLSGGRKQMDKSLLRLQSATEFAILNNSEKMLERQVLMGDTLAKMRVELQRNEEMHEQIAVKQSAAVERISDDVKAIKEDIKRLLFFQQASKSVKKQIAAKIDELSGNVVRHFYGLVLESQTEPIPDMSAVLANLEKSQIEQTGSWLFEDPAWLAWVDTSSDSPTLLQIEGGPGVGKTHLSLSIYQQLHELRDSEHEVCTTYFSCRRPDDQRRHMHDVLRNCAVQIADQSPIIRQDLEAKWRNFEILDRVPRGGFNIHTGDNDIFIYDNFTQASEKQLFVVIDGIDEFWDEEIERFKEVVRKIESKKLRIRFVVTSDATDVRMNTTGFRNIKAQIIQIDRNQILPDVRTTLWKKINSEDSAYYGLRKLSKHDKQKLARRIEEHADGLLYVDQMLRFVADMIREGSIQTLLDSMPANLTELYEVVLQRSLRSLSSNSVESLKSIVMWLLISHHPLTLEWLYLLVNSATGLNGEQVLSFVLQFFEIDILSRDTTSVPAIELSELFEATMDISAEKQRSSNSLRLQPKSRATQMFFIDADLKHELHTSLSDAHRRVFLDAVGIILKRKTSNASLYEYCVEHCLIHWQNIVPEEHTEEERIDVCRAFTLLINDDRYAEGLVAHPFCYSFATISISGWNKAWHSWSKHALQLSMEPEIIENWRHSWGALSPLVTGLVRVWLRSTEAEKAARAYNFAKDVKEKVGVSGFPEPVFDIEAIAQYGLYWDLLRIAGILGTDLDSHAFFAIALVLASCGREDDAADAFQRALDGCKDAALRTQCYVRLASIRVEGNSWEDAIKFCKLALESVQNLTQPYMSNMNPDIQEVSADLNINIKESAVGKTTQIDGNPTMQQSIRAQVLRIQGVAMKGLSMDTEAARSFHEARQVDTDIVPARHLFNELSCLQKDATLMIDRLLSFKFIDRLNFLTADSYGLKSAISLPPVRIILPAAVKSGRSDEVVKLYREIITALDTEEAGAPVKVDLARMLWRMGKDIKEVKFLLNQVLDGMSEERRYKLTNQEPRSVANSALLLMIDILLDEFRSSKKVEDKYRILLEARELPRRAFLASQPLLTDLAWCPYNVAIAHMLRKIGPMSEYEQIMKLIFDKAHAGTHDEADFNDAIYLASLGKILMMMPSTREYGELIYSLYPNPVEDDSQLLQSRAPPYCHGLCLPATVLDEPSLSNPYYKCLICTNSRLCPSCHETRTRWNVDPTAKSATDLNFCCPNGQYLRISSKGCWHAYDGIMQYKSPEGKNLEMNTKELMADVEAAWEKAWEGLASGI